MSEKNYRGNGRGNNGQMFQKFNNIRDSIETRSFRGRGDNFKDPTISVDRWVKDGEDHINIWENGETELGKVLSPSVAISFNHSWFGHFETMEGFWHYIQSEERDDRIRNMTGSALKNFARKLSATRIQHFKALIIEANYQKIKKYKQIVESIKESTLPFDMYYTNTVGLRIRHNYSVWLCAGFEEIRKALKEDRDLDLSTFMDHKAPQSQLFDGVIPEYLRKSKQAAQAQQQAPEEETKPKVPSLLASVQDDAARQQNLEASQPSIVNPDPGVYEFNAAENADTASFVVVSQDNTPLAELDPSGSETTTTEHVGPQ